MSTGAPTLGATGSPLLSPTGVRTLGDDRATFLGHHTVIIAIQAAELYFRPGADPAINEALVVENWNPDVERWQQLWFEYIHLEDDRRKLHYYNNGFRIGWVPILLFSNGLWRETWQQFWPPFPAGDPLDMPPQFASWFFDPIFERVHAVDSSTPTGFTTVSEAHWSVWWWGMGAGPPVQNILELAPRQHSSRVEFEDGLREFAELRTVHGWSDSTLFNTHSDARWMAAAGDFLQRAIDAYPDTP